MTSFIDDNGNALDYDGDDFTITKQSISIFDMKIRGDISVNFNLDNNSINRETLGFYGPLHISSPIFSKITFNLVRNGNQISRGSVVVQRVDNERLECFFIAGNSSWFSNMQFNIQELDLNDYSVDWTYTAMVAQKSATSGIIFPLMDIDTHNKRFSASYCGDGAMVLKAATDGSTEYEDWFCDFYPCFYLKTLMDRVSNYSGFKFSGDLFNEPFYKTAIITPPGGRLTISDIYIKQRETLASLPSTQVNADPFATKANFKITYTGSHQLYSDTNSRWTADGRYIISITIRVTMSVSQAYTIYVYKNGASVANTVFTGVTYVYELIQSANPGDYFEVWTDAGAGLGTAPYTISAGSSVLYTIRDRCVLSYPIIPNAILPTMKAIDLIKSVALRFGCVVTLDNVTKTISLNQIDRIQTTEDWSAYLKSYSYFYEQGFKNNYIKLTSTPEFEVYNEQQTEGYGGANISTPFNVNLDREFYTDPFGAAEDTVNTTGHGMLESYIELITTEDQDSFVVTSVSNSGGYARFNTSGFPTNQNYTIIRSVIPSYVGYHIVSASTATAITTLTPYTQSDAGTVWNQSCSYADTVCRLLTCIPNYDISKIGPQSSIDVYSSGSGHNAHTTWPFAYFSKPVTGKDIDSYRQSLSYGPINSNGYNDESVKDGYYKSIKKMLSNPMIRCKFILPEVVFNNYNFDRKIFISCKDFTGYFWINRLSQYKDSKTEVEADLLFM